MSSDGTSSCHCFRDVFLLLLNLTLLPFQWQEEVDRLTVLQKAMLEDVIDKVRQELVALWDKCNQGPEQSEPFNAHICDGR